MTQAEILSAYDIHAERYQRYCVRLKDLLERVLTAGGVGIHSISCRLKARRSVEGKIALKGDSYRRLDDMTDLAGVRIITHLSDDVDKIAALVEREFVVDRTNSIDKRAILDPDRFGYLSLHYVVQMSPERIRLAEYQEFAALKAELQIRSILQHAWAEIEHDLGYKTALAVPRDIRRRFFRLAGLLEVADSEFVQIRHSLDSYQKSVGGQIKGQPAAVELNKLSLLEYSKTSDLVARLDAAIARNLPGTIIGDPEIEDEDVARLQYLKIRSIAELETALLRHESRIVSLSIGRIDGDPSPEPAKLSPGICLFYLCHVLAAERGRGGIVEYLDRFRIGRLEHRDVILSKWLNVIATVPPIR